MAVISIITIYSALTYTSSELGNLALKQGLWYLIGAGLVAFLIHMKNEYLYRHTVFLYIFGNILLLGLLLFAEPLIIVSVGLRFLVLVVFSLVSL